MILFIGRHERKNGVKKQEGTFNHLAYFYDII